MNDLARKSNWQEQVLQMCSFAASASLPAGLFANCEQEFQIACFPQRGQNSFVSRHSMQPARAQQPLHQGRKNESSANFLLAFIYYFSFVIIHPGCVLLVLKPTNTTHPPC